MVKEEALGSDEINEEQINEKLKPRRRKILNIVWTVLLIVVTLIAIPVTYVDLTYTPVYIDGQSMAPTLNDFENNSFVEFGLMDERDKTLKGIKRGDIIVFDRNGGGETPNLLIKRVIALPLETILITDHGNGDIVEITTAAGTTIRLDESYLKGTAPYYTAQASDNGNGIKTPLTLGANEYYLMGDNRGNSYDSRRLGGIMYDYIHGKLVVVQGYAEGVKISASGKTELVNRHYYLMWNWRYY
mgnify:CR=1 FL=1